MRWAELASLKWGDSSTTPKSFSPYFHGNYFPCSHSAADTVLYGGNVTQPCGIASTGIDYAGGSLRTFGSPL